MKRSCQVSQVTRASASKAKISDQVYEVNRSLLVSSIHR